MWDNDPKNDLWGSDDEDEPEGEFQLSPRMIFLGSFVLALIVFLLVGKC